MRRDYVAPFLAVMLGTLGCGDLKCPSGYLLQGDTCYRCRLVDGPDGGACAVGDAGTSAVEDAASAAIENDAGDHSEDGSAWTPSEGDAGSRPGMDGGGLDTSRSLVDASLEDVNAPESGPGPGAEVGPSADVGTGSTCDADGGAESGSCTYRDSCSLNPCQNGGTCTDTTDGFTCACPTGTFTGTRCELEICGDITVRTAADLAANAGCAEIHGDLTLLGGVADIGATHFPNLTKITGDLAVTTFGAGQPFVETITLSALKSVEGNVRFAASSALRVVSLPALTTIGRAGGASVFLVQQGIGGRLEMPALTTIHGDVSFLQGWRLCSVNLRRVTSISGNVVLEELPWVPYANLQPLVAAAKGTKSTKDLGCCTVVDTMSCPAGSELESTNWNCDPISCR